MADCGSSHYGVILDSGGKTVSKCVPLNDLSAEVLMEDIEAAMEEGASTYELLKTAAAVSNALNNVAANGTSLVFPNASTVREQLLEALANSTSIDASASSPAAILSLASVASSIEKLTRVPTEMTTRSAVLAVELGHAPQRLIARPLLLELLHPVPGRRLAGDNQVPGGFEISCVGVSTVRYPYAPLCMG